MSVQARYLTAEKSSVSVAIDDGQFLGNISGPAEISLSMPSVGNSEYDALVRLLTDGLVISPYQAPLSDGRTLKADIWRRATDAEAETIINALAQRPLRQQRIFADAAYLDHADPLFDELVAGFTQAFGEARTSELLAASE